MENKLEIGDRIEATLPDGSLVRGTVYHFSRLGLPFVIPEGRRFPFFALKCRLISKGALPEIELRRRRRLSDFHVDGFVRKSEPGAADERHDAEPAVDAFLSE